MRNVRWNDTENLSPMRTLLPSTVTFNMVTSPETFLGYCVKAIVRSVSLPDCCQFKAEPLILFSFLGDRLEGLGGWSLPITDMTGTI